MKNFSGTVECQMSITGATDSIKLAADSFTGVTQSSPLDAVSDVSGWGGNPSASVTTVTANDLVTATLSRFTTTDATTNRTSLYNSTASSTLGAASYQLATDDGKNSQNKHTDCASMPCLLISSLVNTSTRQAEAHSFNSLETRLLKGFSKRWGSNLVLLRSEPSVYIKK
jgi:hypothetical protein